MKEFIDKLISRLEEKAYNHFDLKLSEAISIVNELAEEYINTSTEHINCSTDTSTISKMENVGWISVSEKLPEVNVQVIVSATWDGHEYTTDAYFYDGKFYNKPYYQILAGEIHDSYVGDKVIAWMPLPAPYTEGE